MAKGKRKLQGKGNRPAAGSMANGKGKGNGYKASCWYELMANGKRQALQGESNRHKASCWCRLMAKGKRQGNMPAANAIDGKRQKANGRRHGQALKAKGSRCKQEATGEKMGHNQQTVENHWKTIGNSWNTLSKLLKHTRRQLGENNWNTSGT